eukprot:scaffold558_cov111-Cylindrotheca_fusiformis.AAC.8
MLSFVHRCDDKLFEKDLSGQANSGIGFETTRQLASQNATVILACRDEDKAEDAIDDIDLPENTFFLHLDLSDLESVREFVNEFKESFDRLDVLVNNAGVAMTNAGLTEQGFETQFGCNHVAHFLLFKLLVPMLLKTAEDTGRPSRFVSISSAAAAQVHGAELAEINFDDFNFETRKYNRTEAYCQSKLANYLHVMEASKQYDSNRLICVAVHPGWVQSNNDRSVLSDGFFRDSFNSILMFFGYMISARDGAQTSLFCILNDATDMENGAFYSQIGPYVDAVARKGGWPLKEFPNKNATPENAARLWEISEKLIEV